MTQRPSSGSNRANTDLSVIYTNMNNPAIPSSKAEDIIRALGLKPHPEGGFYLETYRCEEVLPTEVLPNRYSGPRVFGTCIYYLLTADTFSMLHRLQSDEIFHFYFGDPLEMLQLFPDGTGKIMSIGTDLQQGMLPQVVVEKEVWQGLRLCEGGVFALLGTTVAPGFDFRDFETGDRLSLQKAYPAFSEMIRALTH
jgi:uncharacterized protein